VVIRVDVNLYVEAGMSAAQRAELLAARDCARAAVAWQFGAVIIEPIIHTCFREACDARFGGMGACAKVNAGEEFVRLYAGLAGEKTLAARH
jgi:hypothetical protein